ncbi:MAG: DUF3047 domain-containing protein [Acidobacteria bacterium]|nr:DUF3047 domain-containing protein [Acidobacteriota bacterium]
MLRKITLFLTITLLIQLPIFINSSLTQTKPLNIIEAGSFAKEEKGLPIGWEHKELKGKNTYSLVDDMGTKVLKAESKSAASGLFKQVNIDPKTYPVVSGQWKVTKLPNKADERKKDGDDCAARMFIVFEDSLPGASAYSKFKHKLATSFSSFVPTGVALCYVWGNKLNKDQDIDSPYTDWVRIIPVETGTEKLGQWVSIERNIYEDFKRIYKTEPKKIVAVGIMTDSDQTKDFLTSYYKDIVFKAK